MNVPISNRLGWVMEMLAISFKPKFGWHNEREMLAQALRHNT